MSAEEFRFPPGYVCPNHEKDHCECSGIMNKFLERQRKDKAEKRSKSLYEKLGLQLEWNGPIAKVLNHPGLYVSIHGKFRVGRRWNKGAGNLRSFLKAKNKNVKKK